MEISEFEEKVIDNALEAVDNNSLTSIWRLFSMAIREKAKQITYLRFTDGNQTAFLINGKSVIRPPSHLFSQIICILRRLSREMVKNPSSSFSFIYCEMKNVQKFNLFVHYGENFNPERELYGLIREILDKELAEKRDSIDKTNRKKRLIRFSIAFAVAALATTIFFLTR